MPVFFAMGRRKIKAYGEDPLANPDKEPNLLIMDVSDGRMDLAPKVARACAWALETGYTQMVLLDDDTFVDVFRLNDYAWMSFQNEKDYVGFQGLTRTWMSGSCVILSQRAMRVVSVSADMKENAHDDIQMGLALQGLTWQHTDRFNVGPDPKNMPMPENLIVATHKCLPDTMREVHLRHVMAFGI
jgi:hypothetical protein